MIEVQKPDALRLADAFADDDTYVSLLMMREAAAELRRLHAQAALHSQELRAYRLTVENLEGVKKELLEALKELLNASASPLHMPVTKAAAEKKARAAIARATGEAA